MKHPRQRNPWVNAAAVVALIALWIAGLKWIAVGIAIVVIVFGIPHYYETGATELILRSGFWRRRLPYSSVEAFEWNESGAVDNPAGGIRLRSGPDKWIHFRPRDQKRFIDALLAHAPHLKESNEMESALP